MNTLEGHFGFGKEYESTLPTLGQSMAEVLKFFNATTVYGIGGDYAANLLRAFEDGLTLKSSSNEINAGFNACGTAEIHGIGVCLVTYTVGSMPCMAAAALAKSEKLPVIFISGSPGEQEVQTGPLHHVVHASDDWTLEYDSNLRAFAVLGIRSERLQGQRNSAQPSIASEQFFELVAHAYRKKEPVFVEVPRDLVFKKVQPLQLPQSRDELLHNPIRLSGAQLIAKQIITCLQSAKKPVLFFGERLRHNPELLEAVKELCHKQNIPYASNLFAKGILDDFDERSLGHYNGIFGSALARQYIEHEADYLLEICTDVQNHDTATGFGTGTYKIDSLRHKTTLKGSSPNCADVLEVLKLVIHSSLPQFNSRLAGIPPVSIPAEDLVNFRNICAILNEEQSKCPDPFIYFPEIGSSFFASFQLRTRQSSLKRSWLTNSWFGSMGTSIPYARAACEILKKEGYRDIPIVITGDGGFHFQHNELIHFLMEDLFVIVIIFRNNLFSLGKCSNSLMYHCSDTRFNYLSLAQAYGGSSVQCTSAQELRLALAQYREQRKGICMIEISDKNDEASQSEEIQMLNLYIQAQSGIPQAVEKWKSLESTTHAHPSNGKLGANRRK